MAEFIYEKSEDNLTKVSTEKNEVRFVYFFKEREKI